MTNSQPNENASTHRQGCSCWLVILVIAFIGLIAIVGGFVLYKRYLEEQAFSGWSSADRQAFEQWASEPLDIPPEFLVFHEPTPDAMIAKREKVFKASVPLFKNHRNFTDKSDEIGLRVIHGLPLSTTETEAITSFTVHAEPVMKQLAELAQSPDFVSNLRTPLGTDYGSSHFLAWGLSNQYARALACRGDVEAAADAVSTTLLLSRHDPGYSVYPALIDELLTTSLIISQIAKNEIILSELLDSLNVARHYFDDFEQPLGFEQSIHINSFQQMVENGYIEELPRSRLGIYYLGFSYEDYLRWLKKKLPPGDPRVVRANTKLPEIQGSLFSRAEYLKPFYFGILKPYVRQLLGADIGMNSLTADYLYQWQLQRELRSTGARYELTRVALARRIAELNSEPIPVAPEDFVPRYMPEFPNDPFTSGPLQYSPEQDSFYSAGPDGRAGTGDDVFNR